MSVLFFSRVERAFKSEGKIKEGRVKGRFVQ